MELDETDPEEINVPKTACISSICEVLLQKTTNLFFLFNRIVSPFCGSVSWTVWKDKCTERIKYLFVRVRQK